MTAFKDASALHKPRVVKGSAQRITIILAQETYGGGDIGATAARIGKAIVLRCDAIANSHVVISFAASSGRFVVGHGEASQAQR